MTVDRAEAWRRERRAEIEEQLRLLRSGKLATHENRGAGQVDTTQATIVRLEKHLAELDAMPAMLRFFASNLESDYMRNTLARGEETASEP